MKTKKIELYFDLAPAWQDNDYEPAGMPKSCLSYMGELAEGYRRVRAVIELPCFGGTAETGETVMADTETVQTGYRDNTSA